MYILLPCPTFSSIPLREGADDLRRPPIRAGGRACFGFKLQRVSPRQKLPESSKDQRTTRSQSNRRLRARGIPRRTDRLIVARGRQPFLAQR
jgi:hypothetical protein